MSAKGSTLPHSLADDPGDVAVVVRLGAREHCLLFGDAVAFKPGKRLLVTNAPAPGVCPEPPPAFDELSPP
jgi:hypothetical protein